MLPILPLLAASRHGNEVDFTDPRFLSFYDVEKMVFVNFHSPYCIHSADLAPKFSEVARRFPSIVFGYVDCSVCSEICLKYQVVGTPTLLLFAANRSAPVEFTMKRSVIDMTVFLENYSPYRSISSEKEVAILNPYTFNAFLNRSECFFLVFLCPMTKNSRNMGKAVRKLSTIYQSEKISFATIHCGVFYEFCNLQPIKYLPSISIGMGGRNMTISKVLGVADFVEKINKFCGFHRLINGDVSLDYGITDEVKNAVSLFSRARTRGIALKLAEESGSGLLSAAFRSIDLREIENSINSIQRVIARKATSLAKRDELRMRQNLLIYVRDSLEQEGDLAWSNKSISDVCRRVY